MSDAITDKIRKALKKGAAELKSSCDGQSDAMDYVADLCRDVDSDLNLGFEGDYDLEQQLRTAAKQAIEEAYSR